MNAKENRAAKPVLANVSNRHIHLCAADCATLFGADHQLVKIKDLMQPGEHACKETVKIVGKKGEIDNVRILGPLRKVTQVEISLTDAIKLAVPAPVRQSGQIAGSAPIKIVGPAGTVELKEGCIVALRHVHMTLADAAFYGITSGELVSVKCPGIRGLIFENVVARASDMMALECHLDTDEANAAGLKNGTMVTIL
ncbi:MAG: phosphate propanoyltransferase [Endomicrobiales bacterium]|jgi:putative phosphotransacetylase